MNNPALDSYLSELAHKHSLGVNDLDQRQFVEVMRQMILSGDMMRHVSIGQGLSGSASQVIYIPYQGVERLRSENREMKRQLAEIKKALGL